MLFVSPRKAHDDPSVVSPPDDFRFPWTRPGVETPAPSGGRGDDESFSSVDEALPTASADDELSQSRKPGLFSKFFPKPLKESAGHELPIEIHEDRIDAAANALDKVGEQQFESFAPPPAPPSRGLNIGAKDSSFASVDDALPAANALPVIYEPGPAEVSTDEFAIVVDDAVASSPPRALTEEPTLELEPRGFSAKAFIRRLFRVRDVASQAISAKEAEAVKTSAIFLLAKFRAFYNEIIRFQHQHSEFTAGFATAVMSFESGEVGSPDAAAEGLSKRLADLLDLQMAEAKWMGGEAGERYPDAQYAMAALADEIFTHTEWEGSSAWPKFSLERKVYKTHAAEVELFKRIDRLLKDSPDTEVARDLARVYLLVLAAGFQGKWRPFGLTRPIAEYRRRLYEYIHREDPLMLYAPERRVFPDATSRTLAGEAVARFSTAQRWAAILVFLVVSYTVVAHIAWSRASADLKDVTTRIKSGSAAGGP